MADLSTTLVIFGASGDLTQRKLVPALYNLYTKGRLPESFRVVGLALTEWDDDAFRARMKEGAQEFAAESFEASRWSTFAERLSYLAGNFSAPEDFSRLDRALSALEQGPAHRLYYLATPPRFFPIIIEHLAGAGMTDEAVGDPWRRVVIEKPFGSDLESARNLNQRIHQVLEERQIYRIDHYLGKETVQNILVFRFGNAIFEPIWNRNLVKNVQITVLEAVDVGRRAGYYDQAGVLRDMFQNHLMQLLALVAMEPPASMDPDALRNEKVKLLSALRPIPQDKLAERSVRAQYEGYRDAEGVAPSSETPTYAALKLYVDNWRWQGVPFYLRSGKALSEKRTEIIVEFNKPPAVVLSLPAEQEITTNLLALCIQPDEGIHLRFEAKVPDTANEMRSVDMAFHYADSFGECTIPEAYERLLLDAIEGDPTLFTRSDGIEAAWRIIDPILRGWAGPDAPPLPTYPPGTEGPAAADQMLARDGHVWHDGCGTHH